ncbi:hypothetical protein MPLSOD_110073 [Mesorhizobium sp. SOD10]|nr:hypothetical protein MPLSOD_110073 [Mesorhizobium sp. SOD10]
MRASGRSWSWLQCRTTSLRDLEKAPGAIFSMKTPAMVVGAWMAHPDIVLLAAMAGPARPLLFQGSAVPRSFAQYDAGSDNLSRPRGELLALHERGFFVWLFHPAVPALPTRRMNALASGAFRDKGPLINRANCDFMPLRAAPRLP